jgi:WhiB family redox-sensing transcriptional regulator
VSKTSRLFNPSKNRGYPPVAAVDQRIRCADEDPIVFFPERDSQAGEAIEICRACSVREACLEFALRTEQGWGVWGGTTPNQRLEILRKRGLKK